MTFAPDLRRSNVPRAAVASGSLPTAWQYRSVTNSASRATGSLIGAIVPLAATTRVLFRGRPADALWIGG